MYFKVFMNRKQIDKIRLLLMAEFVYSNVKNASMSYIVFKLNCGYYTKFSFKNKVNSYSKSYFVNEFVEELKELIEICC